MNASSRWMMAAGSGDATPSGAATGSHGIGGGDDGNSYIIRGGRAGSDRLTILANATWPTSKYFLRRAGLADGMDVLDVGCGNGAISARLFELIGPTGAVHGIDMDADKIAIAQRNAAAAGLARATFTVGNIANQSLDPTHQFDCIYLRLILSHVTSPAALLTQLRPLLKPSGIMAIEDVEFDGHHCTPSCPAFDRYVALYTAAAARRGADANIGPTLVAMTQDAGYHRIVASHITPEFTSGDGKLMAQITMEAISSAVVSNQLASQAEVDDILRELEAFAREPSTVLSIPTLHQLYCGV